ncbi:MAG: Sir2 family NAD-dependent protein deacetylase [Victivallaceae bacterium]|nr:Sir2 family NAD-dependent protein deacetylase [Victivallaceae bacterium]
MMTSQQKAELWARITRAKHLTAFTGAGVSTLSGIRDFRGSTGVYSSKWHGHEVEEILSLECFLAHPELFYEWAKEFVYCLEKYQPSAVHRGLAQLQQRGMLVRTYTQNIDCLHTAAGSRNVGELHGSPAHHHCLRCGKEFPYSAISPLVLADKVPYCPSCGGLVKPDIVFYSENLNEALLEEAYSDMERSDLLLVLGSSLTVQPAASLPLYTLRAGGDIVLVNQQETYLDGQAKMRFDDLEEVFCFLLEQLSESPVKDGGDSSVR